MKGQILIFLQLFRADFIPFVAQDVKNPDTTFWATNNYIVSNGELGPWIQILSVGAEPAPSLIELSIASGGRRPYQASVRNSSLKIDDFPFSFFLTSRK